MRRLAAPLALSVALALAAACGDPAADDPPDAGIDAAVDAGPTPDEIDFEAREDLPPGSWLVANDWTPIPNVVFALPAAEPGAARRELFAVNRVWSMGATDDGAAIYFAAWDARQEERYGITLGDAIQNTWVYEPATRRARAIAWGNLNDECHAPSADGAHLYVCRRYDFTPENTFLGWRIGRITLATGAFEFLRPDAPGGPFELHPLPLGGGAILYEQRARPPATGASLWTRDLGTGAEQLVRADAARPVLAPDGRRVLFQDRTDLSRLKLLDLDAPGAAPVPVSPTPRPGSAAWSPDGDTIVYTVYDEARICDHLERVTRDGDGWSAPARVRDCATTGEFITDLAWVLVP